MSLRFYFGPSEEERSRKIYEEMITRSMQQPDTNFFVIVPDQFTMQTQKELVTMHERGGILNIDVLSFGRLHHRVMEELGGAETPVLDDTGKSLVLQKVAAGLKEQLPTLGGHLHKQGYIHEVKSALSEFMQYGIGPEDVSKLIAFSDKRGALHKKLRDLETLYRGFTEYIQDKFITTEETLDVLRRSLAQSKLLPGSVVVLDGFTGFTPIQNRLLQEIMALSQETIVSVSMGEEENPFLMNGEQELFYMSKKMVQDCMRLAKEVGVSHGEDVFVQAGKEPENALHYLRQSLFRYGNPQFENTTEQIRLFAASTPKEEVMQTGIAIRSLIRTGDYAYRDIAVIMGDLEGYALFVETEFQKLSIPCYIDRTRGIVLNPMIEYIKSALALFLRDFSYESVFHYLRSGMSDITMDEVDQLENYVLQTGIRGLRNYKVMFTRKTKQMGEDEEALIQLNGMRGRLLEQVSMLVDVKSQRAKATDYVTRLYEFLVQNRVQQKLGDLEQYFEKQGQPSKAKEYAQIYRLVCELLNQIYHLLGEEEISLQEFADILEAGFDEIEVGTIPQNVDRVLVGDMERTRIKSAKVLFFLGVNDGNIPKGASKGGIISDVDREFLRGSGIELAPSPRQQMFIQRFYLYLNLTRPTELLYLSFAKMDNQGKSVRPAYLVDTMRGMFPQLSIEYPELRPILEQVETPRQGVLHLAGMLRDYAQGVGAASKTLTGMGVETGKTTTGARKADADMHDDIFTLYDAYGEGQQTLRDELTRSAFKRYQNSELSKEVAKALYGQKLYNSISRLETFAACAYRHFLQYGLTLKEREEFGFEAVDMGNIYHGVLQVFAERLAQAEFSWFDFTEDFAKQAVQESLAQIAAEYGSTVLYSTYRNQYAIRRMERILTRTVLTIKEQLSRGVFRPTHYEVSFRYAEDVESVHLELSKEEQMHLTGRIDRIDVAEDTDHVYVKVVDYKSGEKKFDLAAVYFGLQLQLVVYMNAACELVGKKSQGKEVVPAAMLYYHVADPTIETQTPLNSEELNQKILEKLKLTGIVNDSPEVVEKLDAQMADKSDVIPVEKNKDGNFTARSSVMSGDNLKTVSDYVNIKMRDMGREMLDGNISVNPYERGNEQACTYCPYKRVCGFDSTLEGYERRKLPEYKNEELFEKMEERCGNIIHP